LELNCARSETRSNGEENREKERKYRKKNSVTVDEIGMGCKQKRGLKSKEKGVGGSKVRG
jgi:hypothetical protein